MGYEEDRVVYSLVDDQPDKVYFLVDKTSGSRADEYLKAVISRLTKEKLKPMIITKEIRIFDYYGLMNVLNSIIREEQKENNIISINVASGSSISAIAGYQIACMNKGVKSYYVKASTYTTSEKDGKKKRKKKSLRPSTVGVDETYEVPKYPMQPPLLDHIKLLGMLLKIKKTAYDIGLRQTEVIKMLAEANLLGKDTIWAKKPDKRRGTKGTLDPNVRRTFKDNFLDEMVERGYLYADKRNKEVFVFLTKYGEKTFQMFEPRTLGG